MAGVTNLIANIGRIIYGCLWIKATTEFKLFLWIVFKNKIYPIISNLKQIMKAVH